MDRGTIKITTIDQLLNSNKYTKTEDLRIILQMFKLPDKGNKKELVNTLLYKNKDEFEVDELIDMLFTKEELKKICRDFDLDDSGKEKILKASIHEKFPKLRGVRKKPEPLEIPTKKKKKSKEKTSKKKIEPKKAKPLQKTTTVKKTIPSKKLTVTKKPIAPKKTTPVKKTTAPKKKPAVKKTTTPKKAKDAKKKDKKKKSKKKKK